MNAVVLVNRINELGPRQTTAMLFASLLKRGGKVWLAEIEDWVGSAAGGQVPATCRARLWTDSQHGSKSPQAEEVARWAGQTPPVSELSWSDLDLIWIRTNPGRDRQRNQWHQQVLDVCRDARRRGVSVVNDPDGAQHWASKASLQALPADLVPPMCVSRDPEVLQDFIDHRSTDCVLKPTVGSRGEGVTRIPPGSTAWLAEWQRQPDQEWVVQEFVESATPGDLRVVTLGGRPLEYSGTVAGMARIPAEGDFRGNLHAGGIAQPLHLTSRQRDVATAAAEVMRADGVWLAGIDLVGDRVIELNVFSTGGLYPAWEMTGIEFADQVVDRLVEDFRLS